MRNLIRKGIRPKFGLCLDIAGTFDGFRRVYPFQRSWIAIAIVLAMDVAFTWPAVLTFAQAVSGWRDFDDLFDLVVAIFLSAWLLGWVLAPLLLTTLLALLLFGREVIRVKPGQFEIFIGLPILGLSAKYDLKKMRNLRVAHPEKKSGKSWRGSHFVFDYGANTGEFGSAVDQKQIYQLKRDIQLASNRSIPRGDAAPEDLVTDWGPSELDAKALGLATTPEIPVTPAAPLTLLSPSSLALIVANLVPIAGTLYLDWKLSDVMVLYWAESAVVGLFNLFKMGVISKWLIFFSGPFFVGHFGGFMAVHFLFIYTIFVKGFDSGFNDGGSLQEVMRLFRDLWPAIAALFISHAYSFFANFMGRKEYRSRTIKDQMSQPYSRIIFMHLVLIFGGGLAMILGETTPVLLVVIVLKIFTDLRSHLKEHQAGEKDGKGSTSASSDK